MTEQEPKGSFLPLEETKGAPFFGGLRYMPHHPIISGAMGMGVAALRCVCV